MLIVYVSAFCWSFGLNSLRLCSAAHCAAVTGNVEVLQALRSERANLWMASHVTGNFPLHEAAIAGHIGSHDTSSLYRASLSEI